MNSLVLPLYLSTTFLLSRKSINKEHDMYDILNIFKYYKSRNINVVSVKKFENYSISRRRAIKSIFIKCKDLQALADYYLLVGKHRRSTCNVFWCDTDIIAILKIYIE